MTARAGTCIEEHEIVIRGYADKWALITGASSGIGAEFARRLAARGMHLVLVARRTELMESLAKEVHTAHGTKCEIISSDLSDMEQVAGLYEEMKKRNIKISLLINNAGFGHVGQILETDVARIHEMLRLNIGALTDLTYRFLQDMIHAGEGGIINVSSVAAFQPVAYMGAYAATKAYVLHFSEALWAEAWEYGVTVMALCPGTTRTDFFDVSGAKGWLKNRRAQTVDKVVKTALRAFDRRKQFVVSGWGNYLLATAVRIAMRRDAVRMSMAFFRPARRIEAGEKVEKR